MRRFIEVTPGMDNQQPLGVVETKGLLASSTDLDLPAEKSRPAAKTISSPETRRKNLDRLA
jgi:hypothetical protein